MHALHHVIDPHCYKIVNNNSGSSSNLSPIWAKQYIMMYKNRSAFPRDAAMLARVKSELTGRPRQRLLKRRAKENMAAAAGRQLIEEAKEDPQDKLTYTYYPIEAEAQVNSMDIVIVYRVGSLYYIYLMCATAINIALV